MKTTKRASRGICDFANVIEYIRHGRYPSFATDGDKRTLRKRSKSFRLDGDKLYYLSTQSENSDNPVPGKPDRLVVLTDEERTKVIAEAHVDSSGVHIGREKATALINQKYYWVGVANMVREFSRSCQVCQANRMAQSQAYELYRASITSAPKPTKEEEDFPDVETSSTMSSSFMSTASDVAEESVKMEFLGPSEPVAFGEAVEISVLGPYKCQDSSRFVVVFMDVFSGWPEAHILDRVTPADVTHLAIKWICRFGVIQNLSVKNCGKCTATQCQPLMTVLNGHGLFDVTLLQGSNTWKSATKWSEVERKLTSFIENNKCWDKCLEFALLPLRISRGRESEYTPSYLTLGREITLPQCLSHRNDASLTVSALDPHLSLEQMQDSTNRLLQLFTEYASDLGKEFKEPVTEVAVNKENFKVPGRSTTPGKRRGRRRRYQSDEEDEDDDDQNDTHFSIDSLESSSEALTSTPLPSGSRKRKVRESQQLKDAKQIKKEKDGETDMEQDQDMCKDSLELYYKSILTYLQQQTYPSGCGEHMKRSVRKAFGNYSVEDGKLMYNNGWTGKRQVITKLRDRLALLKSAHIDAEGNHKSAREITKALSQYYWRNIITECHAFVAGCPTCNVSVSEKGTGATNLTSMSKIRRYEKMADVAEKNYALLIRYLQRSKFPPSTDAQEKAAVEKIADHFRLVKGVLYLIDKTSSMCLEVASRARKMAIKSVHESIGTSIPKIQELCGAVSQKYIWHSLIEDVSHYLNSLSAQESPSLRISLLEKKQLEFLEYFNDEKAFFEKYQSVDDSIHDEGEEEESISLTPEPEQDMDVSEEQQDDGEEQPVVESKVQDKVESSVCEKPSTEVGLSNYVSNTSNKVFVVSTTRNPAQADSEITVHITEETNTQGSKDQSTIVTEKEGTVEKRSQMNDFGEGGLEQLANALALVSDPLTEAAVQSIIEGANSSQKVKVTIPAKDALPKTSTPNKTTQQIGTQTKVAATGVQSQPQMDPAKPQVPAAEGTGEESGEGKKKKTCLFTCNICNQTIRGNVKFKIHLAKHNGQKPFHCEVCNKRFNNIKSRKLHMRKHSGITPYLCNLCGKKFTLIGSLKAHIRIHEKGGNVKIACKICDRVFASKNRYDRHMQFKHPSTPPVFKCDECSKVFTTSRSLRRHTLSFHLNVKYHLCGVCGKSFFRKEYLTSHLAQHQGLSGVKKKRELARVDAKSELIQVNMGPLVAQRPVQSTPDTGFMVHSSNLQDIPHAELQTLDQSAVQNLSSSVIQHVGPSDATRSSQEALETYRAAHIVAGGDVVTTDNIVPVTLYSNSPVNYTETAGQVENTYYAIETPSQDDEQQVAHTVVYGYPAVQYEVECSSGADQLNSEDLSAINLLAQASVCQGNESITYVAHEYQ
ncbi:uncharacterized protein [Argopecten irradians]|uniref:uncharacterized protein n=1 Tax=Argopecten irradians TaxID=31199 RepID=UPI0037134A55